MAADRILLGVIGRAHGVRGLVRVTSHTADPADLTAYGPLWDDRGRRFVLRWRGEGVAEVALLTDGTERRITDRTEAEALTNTRLYVDRAQLPAPAEDDEYYLADLIGLRAERADGSVAGQIAVVHDYGAGASLEIVQDGAPPLIIPFTRAAVPVVDVAGGRVVIAPPGTVDALPPADPPAADGPAPPADPVPSQSAPAAVAMPWRATVLTLFPGMFPGPLGLSLAGRALEDGVWTLAAVNIRDFATDRHRTVDDTPFGGGAGMVLRPDVVDAAVASVADGRPLWCLTPRGRRFTQSDAVRLAAGPGVVLLCGRYEGIDQRVIEAWAMEEVSLGDFVLSGGEPAAIAVLDAAIRLLPGVMGAAASAEDESFAAGLLEYPHYTRPAAWRGRKVPAPLLSGHHAQVAAWRRAEAERVTRERRPDLWAIHQSATAPAAPQAS